MNPFENEKITQEMLESIEEILRKMHAVQKGSAEWVALQKICESTAKKFSETFKAEEEAIKILEAYRKEATTPKNFFYDPNYKVVFAICPFWKGWGKYQKFGNADFISTWNLMIVEDKWHFFLDLNWPSIAVHWRLHLQALLHCEGLKKLRDRVPLAIAKGPEGPAIKLDDSVYKDLLDHIGIWEKLQKVRMEFGLHDN